MNEHVERDDPPESLTSEIYDAKYCASHCGPIPYGRNAVWMDHFGNITEQVIRSLQPKRVFDAGCAMGFLMEAFWDRGVEAFGRDISAYAIAQVRPDLQQYCIRGRANSRAKADQSRPCRTDHPPRTQHWARSRSLCQATTIS
jgi:SAM-dependent methyltransferase